MTNVLQKPDVTIAGGNRGERAMTTGLLEPKAAYLAQIERQRSPLANLKVQCLDLVPARSQAVAQRYVQQGIQAIGRTQDVRGLDIAEATRGTRLLAAVIDDPVEQARLIAQSEAEFTLGGILFAIPGPDGALGSGVVAVGATFARSDLSARADATRLFGRLAAVSSGQRGRSRDVSAPILNGGEFEATRLGLYREAGIRAWEQLQNNAGASGLLVAWTTPNFQVAPLIMRSREGRTRTAMLAEATAARSPIVYYQEDKPDWLFFCLPVASGVRAIELPLLPEPTVAQMSQADMNALLTRYAPPPRVFLTD